MTNDSGKNAKLSILWGVTFSVGKNGWNCHVHGPLANEDDDVNDVNEGVDDDDDDDADADAAADDDDDDDDVDVNVGVHLFQHLKHWSIFDSGSSNICTKLVNWDFNR